MKDKPLSIWQNINRMFQYGADFIGNTLEAGNELASAAKSGAEAVRVISQSNLEQVTLEEKTKLQVAKVEATMENQQAIKELKDKYGDEVLEIIE